MLVIKKCKRAAVALCGHFQADVEKKITATAAPCERTFTCSDISGRTS